MTFVFHRACVSYRKSIFSPGPLNPLLPSDNIHAIMTPLCRGQQNLASTGSFSDYLVTQSRLEMIKEEHS